MADFSKYRAADGVFLVIDPNLNDIPLSAENIRLLCDPHHGLGATGLIQGPLFTGNSIDLRFFAPDGRGPLAPARGAWRAFALYLQEQGYAEAERVVIETPAGPVTAQIHGPDGGSTEVVLMSPGAPPDPGTILPLAVGFLAPAFKARLKGSPMPARPFLPLPPLAAPPRHTPPRHTTPRHQGDVRCKAAPL